MQRMIHKRRMSNQKGASRYKTFGKAAASNDAEQSLGHQSFDTEPLADRGSEKSNPFHNKRRLDRANADIGVSTQAEPDASTRKEGLTIAEEEIDTSEVGGGPTTSTTDVKGDSDEITPDDYLVANNVSDDKPQFTSLSSGKNSKPRSSFREFKRKSMGHINNARESMGRRANARKYDNLDDNATAKNDDEIVNYEHSPGSKRRPQVIEI